MANEIGQQPWEVAWPRAYQQAAVRRVGLVALATVALERGLLAVVLVALVRQPSSWPRCSWPMGLYLGGPASVRR